MTQKSRFLRSFVQLMNIQVLAFVANIHMCTQLCTQQNFTRTSFTEGINTRCRHHKKISAPVLDNNLNLSVLQMRLYEISRVIDKVYFVNICQTSTYPKLARSKCEARARYLQYSPAPVNFCAKFCGIIIIAYICVPKILVEDCQAIE